MAALVLGVSIIAVPTHAAPVIVSGQWLARQLDDPDVVVVDMTADDMQYRRFHLPGAVRLPYSALVRKRRDGVVVRVDDVQLFRILGSIGIDADKHVVAYDDMGGLNAGRLFWELERVGHERVSVLDGGLVRWILDGRHVTAVPATPKAARYIPKRKKHNDNEVSLQQLKQAMRDDSTVLLDVRTEKEYLGNPRIKRSGHIKGAIWWPWDQAVRFEQGFSMQQKAVLGKSLAAAGLKDKDTSIILYCRSGRRIGHTYLTLRHLGFKNVGLYDGSMLEYAQDPGAALVRGIRP
jgi:thiosulfate/3-mercaptopyruvate sulfurtransferase